MMYKGHITHPDLWMMWYCIWFCAVMTLWKFWQIVAWLREDVTRFRCGFEGWGFSLHRDWYNGPYWSLQVGKFFAVWNLDGLPRIFERHK